MLRLAKTSLVALSIIASSALASDVLVTVNGKNITKQDAQAFVSAQAPRANFADLKPAEQKMITERLVEKVLFTQLAEKQGVDKKPEFKRNMQKIKEELLVNMWMKEQMDNAIVSDSEAREFYDKNKDKFMAKATMKARHILLQTESEAKALIDEMKGLKGDALKAKFIELAKTKSTGPSASKGGDLGTFTKGQMVSSFSNAAWALKSGEITATPVKTQFGYHIIYLEKKTDAKPMSYKSVKEKIIVSLRQKQFSTKIAEIAQELKSKAKIVGITAETNTTK
ncbi:Peptidyl-prolyl cis-trans isomerase PpiD [hydrothermal vent metagenome]|uniref:Peptidyl-prolyl cis-trans isomerase PpiD n=1 Tax=hydrothermal vent metagenome TaxID=652676 RepID=A0A1W1CT12_9ZZZZ